MPWTQNCMTSLRNFYFKDSRNWKPKMSILTSDSKIWAWWAVERLNSIGITIWMKEFNFFHFESYNEDFTCDKYSIAEKNDDREEMSHSRCRKSHVPFSFYCSANDYLHELDNSANSSYSQSFCQLRWTTNRYKLTSFNRLNDTNKCNAWLRIQIYQLWLMLA